MHLQHNRIGVADGIRIMKVRTICGLVAIALLTTACGANFNSIGRQTPLPTANDRGVAIHLDAQQRLVVYSAKRYCAEPSPDALAAYAQSIGLGASVPSQGAASLAGASQSTLASIGLRTQSITIMRDALYRMCEAYNNGALGDVMVATLLGRSQDLTAVILAVEQLTGAVAANQVVVTGTTGANTTANLVANDQALAAAQENAKERERAVQEAAQNLKDANDALGVAKTNAEAAQRKLDAANALADDDATKVQKVGEAQSEVNRATETLQGAGEHHKRAEADLQTKQDQIENAKQVVETIEAAQDAALTSTAATTTGAGQFSVVQPRKNLSPEATREIASAVHGLVTKVLDKSYAPDSCMALLTSSIDDDDDKLALRSQLERVIELCVELVAKGIEKALRLESTFDDSGTDPNIELLKKAVRKDEGLPDRIVAWLKKNSINAALNNLIQDKEYSDARKRVIEELKIGQ